MAVGVLRFTIIVPLLFLLSNFGRESLRLPANSSSLAVEWSSDEVGDDGWFGVARGVGSCRDGMVDGVSCAIISDDRPALRRG
jgi:hypothetical protein